MTTPVRIFEDIDAKLNEIIELLKPKAKPAPDEEWEDVTAHCEPGRYDKSTYTGFLDGHMYMVDGSNSGTNAFFDRSYRLRKIDGLHNGPAFIIERRKS